jgi:predicted dehydrogenase
MIDTVKPDVVVVMTPHPLHAEMAIYALRAGCHVLCEKPIALHVQQADAMIAAAEETGNILAINFQQRLRPEIVAARTFLQSGGLGKIQHVDMKIAWTRTARYYGASSWKGRWNGEGGALLMNQCPHDLDLICDLIGMPSKVYAWTPTNVHKISAEDTAQAMLMWESGAIGSFHGSTAEAGMPQRFEIIGTRGVLQINKGEDLILRRFDSDVEEFIATSVEMFAAPGIEEVILEQRSDLKGEHPDIYANFCSAILNGTPVAADPRTAIRGLELANAMIYSHYSGAAVELPLDRQKYADLLADLQAKEAAHA